MLKISVSAVKERIVYLLIGRKDHIISFANVSDLRASFREGFISRCAENRKCITRLPALVTGVPGDYQDQCDSDGNWKYEMKMRPAQEVGEIHPSNEEYASTSKY